MGCGGSVHAPPEPVPTPELAGSWRPTRHGEWTRSHQAHDGRTVENWDNNGRCRYQTEHDVGEIAVVSKYTNAAGQLEYTCRGLSGGACGAPQMIMRTNHDGSHSWDFGAWGTEHWARDGPPPPPPPDFLNGLRACDPLEGEYESFPIGGGGPVESFAFTKRGDQCATWGSASGMNTYTLQGTTLRHHQHHQVTAQVDFSARTLTWSHGYVSRPAAGEEPRTLAPALEGIYQSFPKRGGAAVEEFAFTVRGSRTTTWGQHSKRNDHRLNGHVMQGPVRCDILPHDGSFKWSHGYVSRRAPRDGFDAAAVVPPGGFVAQPQVEMAAPMAVPMGGFVVASAVPVAAAELTLAEMATQLQTQLGLQAGLPVYPLIEEAVSQLGLESSVKGLALIEKAKKCMEALGMST